MLEKTGTLVLSCCLAAAVTSVTLGCSNSDHPAVLPSGVGGDDSGPGAGGARGIAGHSSGGAKPRDAGHGTSDEAGDRDAAPDGATARPEAGCVVHPEVAEPSVTGSPACAPSAAWTTGGVTLSSSSGDEQLVGRLTPDELTVVWFSVVNGVPNLHYADRNSRKDPFPEGDPIFPGNGYYASEIPALSPDGLRIVVVRSDRKAFGEYTRTMRFTAFTDQPSETAFDSINALDIMLPENAYVSDPLLSSDDRTFYYSVYDGISPQTVVASVRPEDIPWALGAAVVGAPLRASCGLRRRPTGLSSDQLTLFYWDELSGTERATFRPSVGAPFVGAVDLGARPQAEPNASCTRLYHSTRVTDAGDAENIVFESMARPGFDAGP